MFVVQHKILKWGFSLCYPVFWLISLLYGHETWWMELSLDANNSEGQFKVTGLTIVVWTWNQNETWWMGSSWWMESPWMLTIMNVSSRSPDVTQGLMAYHCCMDMKLGRWSHLWMPNIIKVNSRSPGVTHGQNPHTIPKQPNLVTTFAEPPFI